MMRLLGISILWIAGFFLIAHSILPHHHHTLQQDTCKREQTQHCQTTDNDSHGCNHNKPLEKNSICKLDQNTIIKKNSVAFFAIVVNILKIKSDSKPVEKHSAIYLVTYASNLYPDLLSGRAPPRF